MPTLGSVLYYGCYGVLVAIMGICSCTPLPGIVQMELNTLAVIYIGSHLSLKQKEIDPITGEKLSTHETLTHKDALIFPLLASGALVSLYLAYKFLSAYMVNLLFTTYLSVLGVGVVSATLYPIMDEFFPQAMSRPFTVVPERTGISFRYVKVSANQLVSIIVGIVVALGWFITKSWVLHNIIGICFSLQAISLVSVGNFKIAFLLLGLLFVYDVFWVFGTNVMVTVAKSFDGPIKIILPRTLEPLTYSIIGLGDIVIPGIVISMALRFDSHLHQEYKTIASKKYDGASGGDNPTADANSAAMPSRPATTVTSRVTSAPSQSQVPSGAQRGTDIGSGAIDIHERFQKLYFWSSMVGYAVGLAVTAVVMMTFKTGQPALLYLVPAVIIALVVPSIVFKQFPALLSYSELVEEQGASDNPQSDAVQTDASESSTKEKLLDAAALK